MSREACGENVFVVAVDRDALIRFPGAVAEEIDFDLDGGGFVCFEVEHFVLEAGHEEGVAGLARFDGGTTPRAAPAGGFAPLPKVVGFAEPDASLRLSDIKVVVLIGRGSVAAEGEEATKTGEVWNDTEVIADGFDPPDGVFKGDGLEFIHQAMHVHEEVFGFHFADAHPFGLPGLVVDVAALGEAVFLPLALHEGREKNRAFVPAGGEDDIAHVLAAHTFDVGFVAEDAPLSAVELGKAGIFFAESVVAIVRNDDAVLAGIAAFEMGHPGEGEGLGQILDETGLERVYVELEEFTFHAKHVDEVGGVFEVTHGGGETHVFEVFDESPFAASVDGIRTDESLIALFVDEAVGVGAVMNVDEFAFEIFSDAVEAEAGAGSLFVGIVGDCPEGIGPGEKCADATFRAGGTGISLDPDVGQVAGLRLCHYEGSGEEAREKLLAVGLHSLPNYFRVGGEKPGC